MNKEKFFERYKDVFKTSDFKSTYAAFKALPIEEQKRLRNEAVANAVKKAYKDNPELGKKRSELNSKMHKEGKFNHKKQSASLKQYYNEHPETKERISKSVSKYQLEHKEELRQRTKEAMSRYFATEEGQQNLANWSKASRAGGSSKPEKELQQLILSVAPDAVFNDRSILKGKELDVYVPSKKVAIEYNGDIWHSEAYKRELAKDCHLIKTKMCDELGIRLIHIFSDELQNKKNIVESIIKSALGVYEKKYFARNLSIKQLSLEEARQFFEQNHINGHINGNKYVGLVDGDTVIQAVSIGKSRFKKGDIELLRMATLLNTQVVGGFSKLLKHCGEKEMTSYLDRRLFNGKGYVSSGWSYIKSTPPSYFYTNGKERFNRMSYMKQRCLERWPDADASKTEHQLCLEHGLYRIYDCGTLIFTFKAN